MGMPFASWLRGRGHDVHVVTGFPNYPGGQLYPGYQLRPYRREKLDGVEVTRVALYPSHDRSALRRMANYVSFAASATVLGTALTEGCDVAYVYHPPATVGLPAMLWKRTRRQPFVFHIQDMWPDSVVDSGMVGGGGLRRGVEAALSAWCNRVYRSASSIAVLSPGMRRLLVERGVPGAKVEVIYNWAEESVFRPLPRDEELARRHGLDGRFNVVFSGNLGLFQGLPSVVRAAARVRHLDGFQLMFVGSGQMQSELEALTRELEVDNVKFVGRLPYREMAPITNLADVLLVSLQDRPFFAATIPSKTQVALACGRPVLMAVRGDAADLVETAGAGLVCRPDDEVAIADAFEQLYKLPPAELQAMGRRGREFYERELSLERGAARLEALMLRARSDT